MIKFFQILTILLITLHGAVAQDSSGYIYGVITTSSDQEYEGFIRWGNEELYWHDIFNGNKEVDEELIKPYQSKGEKKWFDWDWDFGSIWDDKYKTTSHTFACFFGDIDYLEIGRGDKVELFFKNGQSVSLQGGSNDIGTNLIVNDIELGKISIKWSKIDKIDFRQSPDNVDLPYDIPLYGKVKTKRKGSFQGYVKWDLDERAGEDILNGDCNCDADEMEIPFKQIKSIAKARNGSVVMMKNGREFELYGSNDINSGNRGIEIFQEEVGTVRIGWDEFKNIEFMPTAIAGPSYEAFDIPKGLMANIETLDEDLYEGMVIFDIDEVWETEMLDGNDDNLTYQIPFGRIKKIIPKNSDYSIIYLKNGAELLLGDTQDVSRRNDGLLLFQENAKEPKHIEWDDIIYIKFK